MLSLWSEFIITIMILYKIHQNPKMYASMPVFFMSAWLVSIWFKVNVDNIKKNCHKKQCASFYFLFKDYLQQPYPVKLKRSSLNTFNCRIILAFAECWIRWFICIKLLFINYYMFRFKLCFLFLELIKDYSHVFTIFFQDPTFCSKKEK